MDAKPLALVIEDQPELAEIYRDTLQMSDFAVQIVNNGQQALDLLQSSTQPALIMLDMNLPHVSGHYLYRMIRSSAQMDSVPVLIATANSVIADALKPELRDHDFVLLKPISMQQLRSIAARLHPGMSRS